MRHHLSDNEEYRALLNEVISAEEPNEIMMILADWICLGERDWGPEDEENSSEVTRAPPLRDNEKKKAWRIYDCLATDLQNSRRNARMDRIGECFKALGVRLEGVALSRKRNSA